jgi:homospermidine synthase
MKIPFSGKILIIGCGAVSQCLQPLLLRHLDMDFKKITIIDFEDRKSRIADMLAAGATFKEEYITPKTMEKTLEKYVGRGDLIIDLAWNIDCNDILQWCHDHDVMYVNTSVELWDPYAMGADVLPQQKTLYVRHLALRKMLATWSKPGATAVIEHGANPGLVSHWTKVGLEAIAEGILKKRTKRDREDLIEQYLAESNYPKLAQLTGVKTIHISERDTQISSKPKEVGEFVNTWSVAGFHEEGTSPAEMGWGTHERRLPDGAQVHRFGPGNQICLGQMGMDTWVRSWIPSGEIVGMVIRHGEAFTIADTLTVWDGDSPAYRPTVHYAYLPCDAAVASLTEMKMSGYALPNKQRIMNDDIISGSDELGVLLLGHDLTGWWVGSRLSIQETRKIVRGQNATTLQVAASILGALTWMIKNPAKGVNIPDQLPHKEILAVANPYLGEIISTRTDWTPLKNRVEPFAKFGKPTPHEEDVWLFESFLA